MALLGIDVAGKSSELLGAALILVATVGYATAPIIIKRSLADLDPLGPVAVSLGVSTLVLLPAAITAPPDAVPSLDAFGSIVALGVICTAGGLILFFLLIAEAGPSRASVITYFNPLVAVALGLIVLDERLGAASASDWLLILARLVAGDRRAAVAAAARRGRRDCIRGQVVLLLHRIPFSTNVERVEIALGLKGVPFEYVDHDPADRSSIRAVSGQDLVPVVELDGEVLADSPAHPALDRGAVARSAAVACGAGSPGRDGHVHRLVQPRVEGAAERDRRAARRSRAGHAAHRAARGGAHRQPRALRGAARPARLPARRRAAAPPT